uniref:Uncharacterized protein n=1 Tax=Triticum urartu TaxID=4572 RepID=A0A8R7VDI9_TRIUA
RLPVRRLHRHRRHGRQRRAARGGDRAGVPARGQQHHRHQGHRHRGRARGRPHRRQLRHQEVGHLRHHPRPGDQGRRQGGRAQDQEDRHPGALRRHQGGRARRGARAGEEEGCEAHRRQGAVEGAGRRGGPGAVRGRRRRDNLAPGGDHRRARVPGQDPSQDLEVDLLVTTQTPRGHIAKANQSHFTFHLGRGGSRDHNRRLL